MGAMGGAPPPEAACGGVPWPAGPWRAVRNRSALCSAPPTRSCRSAATTPRSPSSRASATAPCECRVPAVGGEAGDAVAGCGGGDSASLTCSWGGLNWVWGPLRARLAEVRVLFSLWLGSSRFAVLLLLGWLKSNRYLAK